MDVLEFLKSFYESQNSEQMTEYCQKYWTDFTSLVETTFDGYPNVYIDRLIEASGDEELYRKIANELINGEPSES